jgi:hypothetical protein
LYSHLQASITDEQDHTTIVSSLSACDQRPEKSSDGESNATVKDLRKILAFRRQRQFKRPKLRGSDFGNDAVTFLKIRVETLPEMVLLKRTLERLQRFLI